MVNEKEESEVKVLTLKDTLDYQKGSVVSRTLLDKKEGTITLFSFDKGEGLSEHTAPYDAFVYVISGKARITISQQDYVLETGQMIKMPANEPHALKGIEQFKMMLVMIKAK